MLFINSQIVVESFWMLVSLSSRQFCACRKDTLLSAAKYSASSLTITQRPRQALAKWPVTVKVFKTLDDRQFGIFNKFDLSKNPNQSKLSNAL